MTDPLFDLKGKVALVTGGSRGLGKAICLALAERGANVLVASRKLEACESVASEIQSTTGRNAIGLRCHVGRWEDCDALVETAYRHFGQVDVLVNNAGMSPLYPALVSVTEALFDKVIAVNLKGAFRLSCLVGSRMADASGGSIINISSIAAVQPRPIEVPYAIAKAGLNTLTSALAHAFGPNVRVNAIMPGPFLTDVAAAWDMGEFDRNERTQIPLQRAGEPNEVVGAAIYLASDAASYTSGAVIKIDGGWAFSPG
jgi:NAD(P)-dependent dehydrogenase (short-subunit alcohol dehydrogenase family)